MGNIKYPGPEYPITIKKNPHRIVVSIGGKVIADTNRALTLQEADCPPVQYIPRKDVQMELLVRSKRETYCPYKGDCSYYSILLGENKSEDAVWTFEDPYDAVEEIKGYLAFYPDKVDSR